MKGVESLRHQLSLAVRVDDHFSRLPWPGLLDVQLDTAEPGVRSSENSLRHADGTYRFIELTAGARQIQVAARDGTAFTWFASTPVVLPLANPANPVVVEIWPAPSAQVAPGATVIRGVLVTATAGQEVQMEVVGVTPPRVRRTRSDASGEFTFVVVGPVALSAAGLVELAVTVPGRVLTSIQIIDHAANPVIPGTLLSVAPSRETRARFNLT